MFKLKVILVSLLCLPLLFFCVRLVSKLVDEAVRNGR